MIRFSLLLALVMLAIAAGTTRGTDDGQPLFSPADSPDNNPAAGGRALQRRYVTIDLTVLGAADGQGTVAGKTLQLDLFDGATITAVPQRIESHAAGRIIWQGQVRDQSQGTVTLVARDGVAAGSIWANGQLYSLYYGGDGVHVLEELPAAEPVAEHPPIVADPEPMPESVQSEPQSVTADDGSTIDVLVVYTPASRLKYGGQAGIESRIDLAIAETNQAYANSQILPRLSLVAAVEVAYNEAPPVYDQHGNVITEGIVVDLYRLKDKDDGYLDAVHDLRDTYAADVVSLIEESYQGKYCGIAYLMSTLSHNFESLAFGVVDSGCAVGYYSFGHELGHNMGSHHDHANAGSTPLFNYSFGYQAPDRAFRTIMAYNCIGGCTRRQFFSNPDVWYNGQPTGIRYSDDPAKAANNARSINEARFTVANWRDSATRQPKAPTALTATAQSPTQIGLLWQDNASGELGYKLQRRLDGQSWASAAVIDLPANATGYVDNGRAPDTTYEYRAWSFTAERDSDFSNVARVTTPREPEVHIGAISGGGAVESGLSGGNIVWRAYATVKIHDAYHGPVNGAQVNGAWSGGASGSGSCVTNHTGSCDVVKYGLGSEIDSVTFSVSDISHGDPYLADHNHDPAGHGTSITAYRPVGATFMPKINLQP